MFVNSSLNFCYNLFKTIFFAKHSPLPELPHHGLLRLLSVAVVFVVVVVVVAVVVVGAPPRLRQHIVRGPRVVSESDHLRL